MVQRGGARNDPKQQVQRRLTWCSGPTRRWAVSRRLEASVRPDLRFIENLSARIEKLGSLALINARTSSLRPARLTTYVSPLSCVPPGVQVSTLNLRPKPARHASRPTPSAGGHATRRRALGLALTPPIIASSSSAASGSNHAGDLPRPIVVPRPEGGATTAVCIFLHGLGDTGHGQVDVASSMPFEGVMIFPTGPPSRSPSTGACA